MLHPVHTAAAWQVRLPSALVLDKSPNGLKILRNGVGCNITDISCLGGGIAHFTRSIVAGRQYSGSLASQAYNVELG